MLVFPTLPVIAITGISYKSLLYDAILYIAFSVSDTLIIILSLYLFRISFENSMSCTITPLAPFSNAFSQKIFPSKLSPLIPMYISPFFIVLVSLENVLHIVFLSPINKSASVHFTISSTIKFFNFFTSVFNFLNYMLNILFLQLIKYFFAKIYHNPRT